MKVYLVVDHVDHESDDVLAIYADHTLACEDANLRAMEWAEYYLDTKESVKRIEGLNDHVIYSNGEEWAVEVRPTEVLTQLAEKAETIKQEMK